MTRRADAGHYDIRDGVVCWHMTVLLTPRIVDR